jgi:hypothetical protein
MRGVGIEFVVVVASPGILNLSDISNKVARAGVE